MTEGGSRLVRRLGTGQLLIRAVLVAAMLTIASGCALIYIPHTVALPPEQFRHLRVVARESGDPVEAASVRLIKQSYKNWAKPGTFPPIYCDKCARDPDHERLEWCANCHRKTATWPAKNLGDGAFELRNRSATGWWRIVGPGPLGWVLYDTWEAIIVVKADNRQTAWFPVATEGFATWQRRPVGKGGPSVGTRVELKDNYVLVSLSATEEAQ